MDPAIAILIGAGLATAGWIYTARRARTLARKQHTINVMLQANFNPEFQAKRRLIAPYIRAGQCPVEVTEEEEEAFRTVLNHYEFVAAGLRNGDFDEQLVRDSERGVIVGLFKTCEPKIWKMRDDRRRMVIYEHLEWLYRRWDQKPPRLAQRACERIIARPFPGARHNPQG